MNHLFRCLVCWSDSVQYSALLPFSSWRIFLARDCLHLGKNAFNNGYYGISLEWFEEAVARAQVEGNQTASMEEITPFYQMAVEYVSKQRGSFDDKC